MTTTLGLVNAPPDATVYVGSDNTCLKDSFGKVYLEDLDFSIKQCTDTKKWVEKLAGWIFPENQNWQDTFKKRFAVVSDNVFTFLSEMGTEVNARVRIDDEKKIVVNGALWYEEALSAESILSGVVWCDRIFVKSASTTLEKETLFKKYCKSATLQIGGKATTGYGRTHFICGDIK